MVFNIYVICLNYSYSLVLRYNWLTQHSSLINWTTRSITFQSSLRRKSYLLEKTLIFILSEETLSMLDFFRFSRYKHKSFFLQPHITIIGAQSYIQTIWIIGLTTFCFTLHSTNLTRRAVRITRNSVDLSTVPPKYHKFSDILSKAKAKILAFHCLYNLQIKLENRKNYLLELFTCFQQQNKKHSRSSSVKI